MVAVIVGLGACSKKPPAELPPAPGSAGPSEIYPPSPSPPPQIILPPPPPPATATPSPQPTGAVKAHQGDSWCAAARAAMSAAGCRLLADQRDSLEDGVAAFNPPRQMVRGKATHVVLAIGMESDREEAVRAAGGRSAETQVARVRIGRYMRATLSGSAFTIVPIGNPQRDLGMSGSEQWEWDVTPTQEGSQTLQLRIETFAQDAQGHATRLKLYQSSPISVSVTVTERQERSEAIGTLRGDLEDTTGLLKSLRGWLLALAGVIVAASLVVWRVRGFGKKPEDDKNDPSGS